MRAAEVEILRPARREAAGQHQSAAVTHAPLDQGFKLLVLGERHVMTFLNQFGVSPGRFVNDRKTLPGLCGHRKETVFDASAVELSLNEPTAVAPQETQRYRLFTQRLEDFGDVHRFAASSLERGRRAVHGIQRQFMKNHDPLGGGCCAKAKDHVSE